ncbi:beta-ketoacyl synthase N-terminal-like domain-containing protein [Streptomyces flaveolus]|uniref:Beta-ketoacyl synthase N-terminal-like domain-containing protein n=1 Tax=Streptomyces flaveolus TaxID=67297 RepID=A0ABV1VKS3_9ACTN
MHLQHDSVWCRPRPSAGRPVRRGHRWRYPRPSITPLVAAAFATVGALSPRTDDPATASRPLDTARDGFDVAEGASVLVIERRSTLGHAVPGPTTPCRRGPNVWRARRPRMRRTCGRGPVC